VVAAALRVREVHIVTPVERPEVGASLRAAADERRAAGERLRWTFHEAQPRFVAGQARAVLELMAGRENLPVTAWQPEAVSGHRGRPTLLSNAETWAHVGALVRLGSDAYAAYGRDRDNPGTTLLTLGGDGDAVVREVAAGTPWAEVLTADQLSRPVLTGGYHGTWAPSGALAALTVSRSEMAAQGLALGAGVVITSARTACPVERTLRIVDYLAGESARRCGPCRNGLPALAGSLRSVVDGIGQLGRVRQLLDIVERRGACAHPDGTSRLVRSLLTAVPEEVDAHLGGWCGYRAPTRPLSLAGAV
jgi:NADH:ubiquinone oxidoreductase subunit F (NADH-binding)